jgi:hypothetical protein
MSLNVLDSFAWIPQINKLGCSHGTPKSFAATSDGLSDGTTIISTTLSANPTINSDDDLVGWYIECVECENGPTKGSAGAPLRKRIMDYGHTSTRITFEALPFQTKSGDRFKLVNPPHRWWSVDTADGGVKVLDATYTKTDDLAGHAKEGGPYTEVLKSTNITSTTQTLVAKTSTGLCSCASLGASTAVGDLIEAWYYPEILSDTPLKFKHNRLDRNAMTGDLGTLRGVFGPIEISGQIDAAFKGPGTGREGSKTHLDTPLGAVMDASAGGSNLTANTGCTSTSIAYSAGSTAVGDMFATEQGDVFVVTANGATPVTPSPSLRSSNVPTNGETIYKLRSYVASENINYALSIKQWYDKEILEYLWGCIPTVQIAGVKGDYIKFSFGFTGADGVRSYKDHTNTVYSRKQKMKTPTIVSRQVADVRINVDGVDLDARAFSIDFQLQHQQKTNINAPSAAGGPAQTRDFPQGNIDIFQDTNSKALIEKFRYGKPMTMLIQWGEFVGEPGIGALWAYEIECTDDDIGNDQGLRTVQIPWRVTFDPTATSGIPRWKLGMG